MASLIQFERREAPAESPLTPELRQFIERVVVPILVQEYLSEPSGEKPIAESSFTCRPGEKVSRVRATKRDRRPGCARVCR